MAGTVERYGKGWQYRADIGIDPGTGKRRWATKGGFASQKAARTVLNKVLAAADDGMVVTRSSTLFGHYLDEWMDGAESSLKPTTASGYRRAIDKLKAKLGRVRLQGLTTLGIERAYRQLILGGLSAKTVRHSPTVLRRALADAERLGLVSRNAAAAAKAPAMVDKEQSTWTPADLSTFLSSVADHRLFAAFVVSATTGMPRGELLGLRWREVDLDAGRVSIVRTITTVIGQPIETSTKTNKSRRSVALDTATVEVLRAHLERQALERAAAGSAWRETGLVFTREDGSAIHPDRFSRWFTTLVDAAGVLRIRLHDLRHTHATLALEAGVHPQVVSERLGHATVGITLDLYSHVSPAMDEAAAERIAGLLDVPDHSRSAAASDA